MHDLRYPIGAFEPEPPATPQRRRELLTQLAEAPARLRAACEGLSPIQLDAPYRPDGWTVRQVAHHLPDAHLNWYIRVKLALTEDEPEIKPYSEQLWAELPDSRVAPIESSLRLFEGLHARLSASLGFLGPSDWSRKLIHPERGVLTLDFVLPLLVWHCRHHTAHITELRRRMSW